jgi:hypothetical protein
MNLQVGIEAEYQVGRDFGVRVSLTTLSLVTLTSQIRLGSWPSLKRAEQAIITGQVAISSTICFGRRSG